METRNRPIAGGGRGEQWKGKGLVKTSMSDKWAWTVGLGERGGLGGGGRKGKNWNCNRINNKEIK